METGGTGFDTKMASTFNSQLRVCLHAPLFSGGIIDTQTDDHSICYILFKNNNSLSAIDCLLFEIDAHLFGMAIPDSNAFVVHSESRLSYQ